MNHIHLRRSHTLVEEGTVAHTENRGYRHVREDHRLGEVPVDHFQYAEEDAGRAVSAEDQGQSC